MNRGRKLGTQSLSYHSHLHEILIRPNIWTSNPRVGVRSSIITRYDGRSPKQKVVEQIIIDKTRTLNMPISRFSNKRPSLPPSHLHLDYSNFPIFSRMFIIVYADTVDASSS